MRWGLYEFLIMPFGVMNAPLQFMNMMNDVLSDYVDDFVLIFLDGILIYSHIVSQHAGHLGKSWKLFDNIVSLQRASKCNIIVREIEFLSQWIPPHGVAPLKEKIKAIMEWKTPQILKGFRSFWWFAH